jgi:RNA recognition motif-containing protein
MSSDYRPRGGSNSSSTGEGPRRRRGGRGRGNSSRSSGEHRPHTNGTSSHGVSHSGPKKKTNPITAFFNWITGKKKTETRPAARSTAPESRESRPPRSRESERGPRPERAERGERSERSERTERPERPARAERAEPVAQEIVSPKLYVGNLAYEAAESDLFDLFSKVGAVKNVEIATDRNSGRSKGFGFVEMEVLETAKEAAEKLNRTDFMGRQIVVSGAKVDKRPSSPREEVTENEGGNASSSEESSI